MSNSGVNDRTSGRRRAWWRVTPREARQHAIVLAVATWLVSIVTTFGSAGRTSLVGVRKAPDFVHFYTFGRLAIEGRIRDAYDWRAFHAKQVSLVPESAQSIYPPVYPPQAAVIFMPLSRLPYGAAIAVWTLITIGLYGVVVWRAWLAARDQLPDGWLVFAAAAGFPPFWQLVMNGQVTIVILMALFLAWLALERRQPFLAGAALGLLAIKPQFGLPFAAIVLMRREWRMMAGAVSSVGIQALIVWWILGADSFSGYLAMLPTIATHADELEARPFQSHSIRAVTRLLPDWVGVPLWIGLVSAVLWKTGKAWLSAEPLTVRLGLAILASVLVNPHLIIYDATVLILPLIWFGAWLSQGKTQSNNQDRPPLTLKHYGAALYALLIAFLAPSAAFIGIQISVLLMLWLFWKIQRISLQTAPTRWSS